MVQTVETNHVQDWINLGLAALLAVSPFALGYPTDGIEAWNAWISSGVIAVLAVGALLSFAEWEEWVEMAAGLWVVAAPFVIGVSLFETTAVWAHAIVGSLVFSMAAWELWQYRHPESALAV